MILAKDSLKVNSENFHNFRVPELEKIMCTLVCEVFGGVFIVGRVDIRSLAWRVFPCREDLHYYAYLAGSFLVGIPLIRVSRGAQDVSLYIHAWRPSKAMSDSSKIYLSPLASFH